MYRFILSAMVLAASAAVSATDWPMWGGTPSRNMVSSMTGLPTTWDLKTGKNVKWVAELGSQWYGNPVVAGGVVLVGTNNEAMRDPKQGGDRGVLMAFREETGEFMWQATFEKLAAGRANDWPFQGIASSPLVIRGVAYFTTNRGTIVAADLQGFHDNENDGPVKDEKLTGKGDPDIIWSFDMIEEVGAFPHNLANCSPVSDGSLLFCSTGNGQDESHVNVPSPKAPSIIALEIESGTLKWEDNSVGENVLHGQWSTPAVGDIGGVRQVVHAQGDGWVRGYEAQSRQEAVGVRHQPEGIGMAEDAQRGDQHTGDRRQRHLHLQRPGSRARRGRRPCLRDRRHQARRHHQDRHALALRQDPPLDLHRGGQGRDGLPRRLQRLPALRRRQDRHAVLDA